MSDGDYGITDEYMRERLGESREYTLVLLTATARYKHADSRDIIWEHGRRNFALRRDGLLSIVCPTVDDTPLCGAGIFNASVERTRAIMDEDPAVVAGVFTYETHPVRGFPGDALAAAPAAGTADGEVHAP